jgi:hypothetical protein
MALVAHPLLANLLVYAIYLVINGISIFNIWKQETISYRQLKGLLISIQLLFDAIVVLEVFRVFISSSMEFMYVYTFANTTFVLIAVVLLTLVALTINLGPKGSSLAEVISETTRRPLQRALFVADMAYIAVAEVVVWVFKPFDIIPLSNLLGTSSEATKFTDPYLAVLGGVLAIFVAYPSTLLLLARRRTRDREVRRALLLLPASWIGIGLILLIFKGYLIGRGIDASALGYLIAAGAFAVSALVFSRATVLTGFFDPIVIPPGLRGPARSNLEVIKVGIEPSRLIGRNILFEVDSASDYEKELRGMALELINEDYVVFIFTSKGSPVYVSLVDLLGVRFFTFSERVSYPRPSANQYEVLVPRNDSSIILNLLDKTLNTNPNLKVAVVFDSISDMMLASSFESSYKFLKQANELVGASGKTAIFLMTRSAQGDRETSIVRSVFPNHLFYDSNGLEVSKLV